VNPSRVVTKGIVMLLAGVGIMGATQDAVTGFPVTASARLIDAMLNTAGIIAGVGAGLTVGDLLGLGLTTFKPGAAGLAEVGVAVLGAALAAAAFAFASCAPARSLTAVALVAALGQGVLLAVDSSEVGRTWASAIAAVTIGAVCYLVAGRFRVPPLVVVSPRSRRSCRGSTSTEDSLSWPRAKTECSSWLPRSPPRSRSQPA
jgi:Putative threonine/serine exporter/Threonine/Serine exporter, ThrE